MKKYELMAIIDPDIGSDAIKEKVNEIKKLITSQKGDIYFEDVWGLRDLAYTIKKKEQGYYVVFNFDMEKDGLKEIDTILKLDLNILRHLIVVLPNEYKSKSILELEKEAEIEEVVNTSKKEEKKDKRTEKTVNRTVKKEEVKDEKAEVEVGKNEKEENVLGKASDKDSSLEDVDKKLSNLLENPDLNF